MVCFLQKIRKTNFVAMPVKGCWAVNDFFFIVLSYGRGDTTYVEDNIISYKIL
jgi:hypothetical protein